MKRIVLCLLCCGVLLCSGCAPQEATRELFLMDTYFSLTAYGTAADRGLDAAEEECRRLDEMLDRKGDGALARLNRDGGGKAEPELIGLIRTALRAAEETDGAFDPTIAPLADAWGFYGNQPRIPTEEERAAALARVGYQKITLSEDSVISDGCETDLGGIAKGYTADRAAEAMRSAGVTSAILSLGGNVRTIGRRPNGGQWQIAIAEPTDPKRYACTVTVGEASVVTSGGYQRKFAQNGKVYHHILDPATGMPAESGLLSVTVIGEDGALCDALSTALYVMGTERAIAFCKNRSDIRVVLLTADALYCTDGVSLGEEGSRPIRRISRDPSRSDQSQ